MGTTYKEADKDVYAIMTEVLDEHFPSIKAIEPELSIYVSMAWNDKGPSIKQYGYKSPSKIKVVDGLERSQGASDVKILIDLERWNQEGDAGRRALMHRELMRIEPQYEEGGLKTDEYGRPVVRLRPMDWVVSGYIETARIYGEDSLERRAVMAVYETLRQMELPFSKGDDVGQEVAADPAESKPKGKRRKPAAARAEA